MASAPRRATVIHVGTRPSQSKKILSKAERSSLPNTNNDQFQKSGISSNGDDSTKSSNSLSKINNDLTSNEASANDNTNGKMNSYKESSSRKLTPSSNRNRVSPSDPFNFNRESMMTTPDKKPGFFSRFTGYFYRNNSKGYRHWGSNLGKENKKGRLNPRGFYFTKCCCYSIMAGMVALVLLLTLLAVIIIMLFQPKTTTTTTTSTSTTSTSATTTTETTTTATTTTTTTMTTVTILDACSAIKFNQTGEVVAGSSGSGSGANQFKDPTCLYIDSNDYMYICDHHNNRVQKWLIGASSGTTIAGSGAGTGATATPHAQALTFDKNGFMYVTSHDMNAVVRFPPNSSIGTTVAGATKSGSAVNQLDEPTDMYVDSNFNVYITDAKNDRVMKWAPNATSGVSVISSSLISGAMGIVPVPNTANQVYISDKTKNAIYLWTLNTASPTLNLTQVMSSTKPSLTSVQRMNFDNASNLFVADEGADRIVMFCINSTIGVPVVGDSGTTPALTKPLDMAFDSRGDLYVLLTANQIVKYTRI